MEASPRGLCGPLLHVQKAPSPESLVLGVWLLSGVVRDPQGVRADRHRSREAAPGRNPQNQGPSTPSQPRQVVCEVRIQMRLAGLRSLPPCSGCESLPALRGIMSGIFHVYDFIFETNQYQNVEEILSVELLSLPQTKLASVFSVMFSPQPVLL